MNFKCSSGKRTQAKLTKPTVGSGSRCQTSKTPRRTVFGLTQVDKPLQSDFQINRDIFTPSGTRRHSSLTSLAPEKHVKIPETDLAELNSLIKRLPPPETAAFEDAFMVTPVLDRILGTIDAWGPDVTLALRQNETILALQNSLFGLIEIDDFLVRTVTCRILLCFSQGNEDLLTPISRIFYKLSCDKSNFDFFVDEGLENVLLNLLQSQEQEPSVYAAGSIKNVTKHEGFRQKLVDAGFFAIIKPFFQMDDADPQVVSLLLHAMKHMCENEKFRKEIAKQGFILRIAEHQEMFESALSLASLVPELPVDDRIDLMQMIKEKGFMQYRLFIEGTVVGAEKQPFIGNLVLEMTKRATMSKEIDSEETQELLQVLCSVASKAAANKETCKKYEDDGVFVRILKDVSNDTETLLLSLEVVKQFVKEENKAIAKEYAEMYEQIE